MNTILKRIAGQKAIAYLPRVSVAKKKVFIIVSRTAISGSLFSILKQMDIT
jgi:hypothetical protein